MATKIIKAQITQRRDTLANWASVNPVLLPGELGFVTDDVNRYKIGDGVHAWNDLPFRGFDGALAQNLGDSTTAAISQKAVTDELKKKVDTEKLATINGQRIDEGGNIEIEIEGEEFDKQGNYPLLHVGTADDLAGRGESVPAEFGFRASGGKSIKDGRAYIKRIKGNSVVWNQKVEKTYIDRDKVLENIEVIPQNHKFALIRSKAFGGCYYMPSIDVYDYALTDGEYAKIFVQSHVVDAEYSRIYSTEESGYIQLIDLTQMFGEGNEPSTIEDFYARVATLGVDLNAYNEGEVIHCNTESIKSVGDNAWDEEWELGAIDANTGEVISGDFVMPSNYIKVLPNEQYVYTDVNYLAYGELFCYDADKNYIGRSVQVRRENAILTFRTLPNCSYILFRLISSYGTTYKHDILISLYHSGWKAQKDDQYQPYWQDILPLPIIRKYFPDGMKKAGSAHDEIRFNKASGKWEAVQRIGSVDLGSLPYAVGSTASSQQRMAAPMPSDAMTVANAEQANILCKKYDRTTYDEVYAGVKDKVMSLAANGTIQILDSSYADAESFKAAMQGVILYYELAEPIVTELDAEDQNFRDYYNVADFGTEQSQSSVPSAAFSADIIYQFNAVDMIREHELEITELQNIIATMQAQLTSLINGGQ